LATATDESLRDASRAVDLAKHCCELTSWQNGKMLDTLATAYAATGDFNQAVEWSQKALSQETAKPEEGLQKRLQLFKDRKPYIEPPQ
jgi:hypothetical protein